MSKFYNVNSLEYGNNKTFYRIRQGDFRVKSKEEEKKNKEQLFHIKDKDRHLIGAYRYSIAGFPCLYAATDIELAWFESGMPKKFSYCAMKIYMDEKSKRLIKFIDFSNRPVDFISRTYSNLLNSINNEERKTKIYTDLLNYIIIYPLALSCSLKVENRGEKFVQEYILPQMLMHWIREKDDYYGVKYKSALNMKHVDGMGGYNIAFPVKEFREDGLCKVLTSMISISDIRYLDVDKEFDGYEEKLSKLNNLKKNIQLIMMYKNFSYKYGREFIEICDDIEITYKSLIYGKNENLNLILQHIECLANYIDRIEESKEYIIKSSTEELKKYRIYNEIEIHRIIETYIEEFITLTKSIVERNLAFKFNTEVEFKNGDLI